MKRVIVIGTTGSGKTTFARTLAGTLGVPHGEQDAWYHQPGWVPAPLASFRARVAAFTAGPAWVMDGNYSKARDIGWAHADTLVWLDYPGQVVFWRVLTRTLRRVLGRQELWNGNRETVRGALSPEGPVRWFFRTHWQRRRDTPAQAAAYPHLRLVRLRTPREAAAWLARVPHATTAPGSDAQQQPPA
ncbi:adenylate kinase [Deinococcus enclensis]|uniref:Adenylate kinase family enzyme n=1 Tax=Deinococcus enclensis TaxID=1049582 RepID=A0ABT9M9B9_9DEIO|nr:adenylate kinase [Deinococcus enclensis]MDP9763173.1 adenylate kinase family enzyme [Deinococcus enclensis]